MSAEGFFKEFNKLILSQPLPPLKQLFSEDCFGDHVYYSKNVQHGFDVTRCTNSAYIYDAFVCHNCIDCDYPVESELCYESVDPFKAFNCDYTNYCSRIQDSSYCHWCWDSHDLFGCVYLKNKSFCIFNRQFTEEEYRKKVKELRKLPPEKIFAVVEELKNRYPLTQTIEGHNENTSYGNYIHYNKNCYLCFDAANDENCAYLYDSFDCTNCFDLTYGYKDQLTYQSLYSPNIFNCNYVYWSENCMDSDYLISCVDVKNSLGCINLQHKQYCILNRQFTKDEYEKISKKIKQELRQAYYGWDKVTLQFSL